MVDKSDPTRRRVLQTVGAGVGTAGIASTVSGRDRSAEQIIGLEAGADASIATDRALEVTRQLDFGDVGSAVVGRFETDDIQALSAHSSVRYTEKNGEMYALDAGAESGDDVLTAGEDVPYGIELTDADAAVDDGATGFGVTVAIVDSGVDPNHETLSGNVTGGYAADGVECTDGCAEPWDDDNGHGTHVAGTAAAEQNSTGVYGVAPDASILGVKVLSGAGSGSFDGVADGINWSVDNGADIVNLSLGGPQSDVVEDAVEYADDNGVIVVAAAGNDGCDGCVGSPADHPDTVAVSATDQFDNLASFSSTGPEVDIAAPGADVLSTLPGDEYGEFSGTSMSAPHVAGAAASVAGEGTPSGAVVDSLKNGAEDIGLDDNEQGDGRLNVLNAVNGGGGDEPVFVTTGDAESVTETSATLTGTMVSLEDAFSADVWFEYGPVGAGLPETVDAGTVIEGDSFSADISGLDSGTTYEFVAVASTSDETDEGDINSFQTDSEGGFCFVTTATANDTETLDSLRRFRDDSMKATPVGKGLVGLYYRISPPIARTLDRHPDSTEAGVVRKLVALCAALSDTQDDTDSRLGSAVLGVALTMLYLVGLVVGVLGHTSLRARETLGR